MGEHFNKITWLLKGRAPSTTILVISVFDTLFIILNAVFCEKKWSLIGRNCKCLVSNYTNIKYE